MLVLFAPKICTAETKILPAAGPKRRSWTPRVSRALRLSRVPPTVPGVLGDGARAPERRKSPVASPRRVSRGAPAQGSPQRAPQTKVPRTRRSNTVPAHVLQEGAQRQRQAAQPQGARAARECGVTRSRQELPGAGLLERRRAPRRRRLDGTAEARRSSRRCT